MGHEGEWIRGEPAEDDGPDDDLLGDEWLDDGPPEGPDWPMETGGRPGPGLGLGYGKGWGHGGVPGFSGWIAVAVAVVAAAAGVVAGFFLVRGAR